MSGFHSSSKPSETFINDVGKKPEEGRCQEIKPCLAGREMKGHLASSHSLGEPESGTEVPDSVSLLAGAAPRLINIYRFRK